MRPKIYNQSNLLKLLILLLIFLGFFLLMPRRVALTPVIRTTENEITTCPSSSSSCTQIPQPIARALIHYSTSTITPQQTLDEISVTSTRLELKSPCNFLVFGLGHDSLMWSTLNYGGRTVFLEEDMAWIHQISQTLPDLESHHVTYNTKVTQADHLLEVGKNCVGGGGVGNPKDSTCELALKGLPSDVYDTKWDLIMVDAPTGYHDNAPGRMAAIYTVGMLARNREDGETDVFVHDVNRAVEDNFSTAFLCDAYLTREVGRLRHFTIPSRRDSLDKSFCPQ